MAAVPIRPDQVEPAKTAALPPEVFEVFNELITANFAGRRARVLQKDASAAIATRLGITEGEAFARKLLDVEHAYREAGWTVEYDKPGFNESYKAVFVFTKPA